jgi:hypothetical protein
LRFLYVPQHPRESFSHGDTFSGTGTLSTKTFKIVKSVQCANGYLTGSTNGALAYVTANPD